MAESVSRAAAIHSTTGKYAESVSAKYAAATSASYTVATSASYKAATSASYTAATSVSYTATVFSKSLKRATDIDTDVSSTVATRTACASAVYVYNAAERADDEFSELYLSTK